jgi:pimeloyl-ACP methyl ester carboxylesterase
MKKFDADFIGQTRSIVTTHFFAPGANEDLKRKIAYDMSLTSPRVGIPSMRAVMEYDFTAPLKDISVPIVAINSNLGEPVNEARIRKTLPKFRQVTLAGVGHFLMMEDPVRFNAALESEIEGLLLAASQ